MLRSKVGYSMNEDSFTSGVMTAKNAIIGSSSKIGFLYTSCVSNVKEVVKGVRSVTDIPLIGCTSSGAIMVPEGIVASEKGFAGMMSMSDVNLTVGVACHEAGKNARLIGRKVAMEAANKAGMNIAPSYFYMVASPKEEEDYLMGIQDVIGRVPFFGGSAADDTVEGKLFVMKRYSLMELQLHFSIQLMILLLSILEHIVKLRIWESLQKLMMIVI